MFHIKQNKSDQLSTSEKKILGTLGKPGKMRNQY